MLSLEPRGGVLGLLREPAISGAATAKRELEGGVDGEVGLAHLAAVELAADLDGAPEVTKRDGAGIADRPLQKDKVFLERGSRFGLNGLSAVILLSVKDSLNHAARKGRTPDVNHVH